MIIGLTGFKESGKTTVAHAIEDYGFEVQSFAYTAKLIARILLRNAGLSESQIVHAQLHKEQTLPIVNVSFRHLLQTLATDWGRMLIDPALWVNCAKVKLAEAFDQHQVFDDVRFEDEAAMVRELGGVVVHIERPGLVSDDQHVSEAGIAFADGDFRLINDCNQEAFVDKAIYLVQSILTDAGKA